MVFKISTPTLLAVLVLDRSFNWHNGFANVMPEVLQENLFIKH
jgi:hypothetical protein